MIFKRSNTFKNWPSFTFDFTHTPDKKIFMRKRTEDLTRCVCCGTINWHNPCHYCYIEDEINKFFKASN